MTLAADIRIASVGAKFALPFVRRGIVPESASSWFVPRIVGISQSLDWMLSSRAFSASEAQGRACPFAARAGGFDACRYRRCPRHCRSCRAGVSRSHPAVTVANARSRLPYGGPPDRVSRGLLTGPREGHSRRRGQFPRAALAQIQRACVRRHVALLSLVAVPRLLLRRRMRRADANYSFRTILARLFWCTLLGADAGQAGLSAGEGTKLI